MTSPISRRRFLKSSLYGATTSLLAAPLRAAAQPAWPLDLEYDVWPLAGLPRNLQERTFQPERTGPLAESYYAVHVSVIELVNRRMQRGDAETLPADDEARFRSLAEEVNAWFERQLTGRRLRFIYAGPLPPGKGPQPDAAGRNTAAALWQGVARAPAFGGSQQVQVLLVRDRPGLAAAVANTVLLSWPPGPDVPDAALPGLLAHLLGHALGLAHPRPDVDTAGTPWASEFSFMHPDAAAHSLEASLVLDSPLNPEKARLVRSGFFPYRGVIHTAASGAIPLQAGMVIEGEGQEVRVAHGNYVLPMPRGAAALTVRGANLTVDLGGALLRGDDAPFVEFGPHETHGIGVQLLSSGDGGPALCGGGPALRGGTISGYHYGVRGDNLRQSRIEGVTLVHNRRLPSDARRGSGDPERGVWLDFWLTPHEDATEFWVGSLEEENLMAGMGAGLALFGCHATHCSRVLATYNTVGVADYFGQSNRFEDGDLGGCPMGLRFWQARGTETEPIAVRRNRFRFNTQPDPWWWSHGDSAAIIAAGVEQCVIEENEIVFGGDGLFLSGFPRFPARSQALVIRGNVIERCYAHGVEVDFGQDCVLADNRIAYNWLSGVWAGHTAGLLARGNTFAWNNRGRMYGGWTDTQGALSCAQGRVTLHQNQFEDNWVAVNLWRSPYQPWWLFAGEAAGHAVTGNTFRNNRVAVRLGGVTDSAVTGNLMQGNNVDLLGELADNQVTDNGPATDPSQREAWFFPVQTLLFDPLRPAARFGILRLHGDDAYRVPPDELRVEGEDGAWLDVTAGPDGAVYALARPGEQGIRSARVEVAAGGRSWRLPVKAMCGEWRVAVGRGDPGTSAQDLGLMPAAPAAIFGLFPPISDNLGSTGRTDITGAEAFWCRFVQEGFRVSAGAASAFALIFTDCRAELTLGESGPTFAPEPPGQDEGWLWRTGLLELSTPPAGCRLDYVHGPELVEKGMPPVLALWLYPLDAEDLAHIPPVIAAPASPDYLLSMPGARRRWPRPREHCTPVESDEERKRS